MITRVSLVFALLGVTATTVIGIAPPAEVATRTIRVSISVKGPDQTPIQGAALMPWRMRPKGFDEVLWISDAQGQAGGEIVIPADMPKLEMRVIEGLPALMTDEQILRAIEVRRLWNFTGPVDIVLDQQQSEYNLDIRPKRAVQVTVRVTVDGAPASRMLIGDAMSSATTGSTRPTNAQGMAVVGGVPRGESVILGASNRENFGVFALPPYASDSDAGTITLTSIYGSSLVDIRAAEAGIAFADGDLARFLSVISADGINAGYLSLNASLVAARLDRSQAKLKPGIYYVVPTLMNATVLRFMRLLQTGADATNSGIPRLIVPAEGAAQPLVINDVQAVRTALENFVASQPAPPPPAAPPPSAP